MSATDAVRQWEQQGCAWCREKWIYRSDEPRLLGEADSTMVELYRCTRCGSYWAAGVLSPRVISAKEAEERMPDVHERERRLGITFPPHDA